MNKLKKSITLYTLTTATNWWYTDTPFGDCQYNLQNTAWSKWKKQLNDLKVICRLKGYVLSMEELQEIIRPAGFGQRHNI